MSDKNLTAPLVTGRKRSSAEAAVSLVYEVPEAGAKLGLTRNGSYAAAARGDFPTIRIGRLLKVPKAAFDRMLETPAKA